MTKEKLQLVSPFQIDVFSVIFKASVEGILVVDTSGSILLANPSCYQLFGYINKELTGRKVEDLIPVRLKKGHVKLRAEYSKNPEPRRMGHGRDLRALKKDGLEFPVEISLTHTTYDQQNLVIAFIIDITERNKSDEALRNSEEQLLKYASELENRVQERTRKVAETAENLENANSMLVEEIAVRKKAESDTKNALDRERELNELKSRFVSMASHEFRTPLSTILSSAALISKYIEKEDEGKRSKHVNRIKSNVDDLTGILNDFLSLAKLEEGKIKNDPTEFEVNAFLVDLIEEMKLGLKQGQEIIFEPLSKQQQVFLDKTHLKSIIANLTSNAIKYSPENEGIHIVTSIHRNNLVINIKDNGMGIPINEQAHLFERFFRAKNVINIQGTGLGLNLIKKYIELIDGSISFESEESVGTTFTVKLPFKNIQS